MPSETPIPPAEQTPTSTPGGEETPNPETTPAPEPAGSVAPLLGGGDEQSPPTSAEPEDPGDKPLLGGEENSGGSDEAPALTDEEVSALEAPEGVDVDLFHGVVSGSKLTSDGAKALAENLKAYEAKRAEQLAAAREAERVEWHKVIKADPNWESNTRYANAALKRYASPELVKRLTGYDDPDVIAMLAAIGKRDNPGSPPPGPQAPPKPQGPNLAVLYPTTAK